VAENAYCVKNDASGFIFYVALEDQANAGLMKANPTLAAGDVKISIDGGAFANLGTLPAATPASGVAIKVTLSQAETNGDHLTIAFIDAAGAEWYDLFVHITPVTATRGLAGTALPAAAADAAGGLPISDAGGLDLDAQIGTDIDAILTDTAEIGAAGAGLTAVPWNAAWDAEVESEATDALEAAIGTPAAGSVAERIKTMDDAYTATRAGYLDELAAANIPADVDAILTDTGTTIPGVLGSPAGADMSTDIAAIKADSAAILTDTGTTIPATITALQADLPNKITKNTALAGFPFKMVDATDGYTAETGVSVTATRSIDGAAFAACANAAAEVASGWYKIDLAAADLNGDTIVLRFTGTGCRATEIVIATQPT